MGVLTTGSGYYERTANLPSRTAMTICGWGRYPADDNQAHTICGLNNAGDTGSEMQVQSDGATFGLWNGSADVSFGVSPVAGREFFWCLTLGAAILAYWRYPGERMLRSLRSANNTSGTPNSLHVGTYLAGGAGSLWIERVWNVKCWDRQLTEAQVLVESNFYPVVDKAAIQFHWRLKDQNDYFDRGPKGRAATSGAGITYVPEFTRLREIVTPKRAFDFTAAAGGTRGIPFGTRGVAFNGGRTFVGPIN